MGVFYPNRFDLDDMADQLRQLQKMGGTKESRAAEMQRAQETSTVQP